MKSVRFIIGIFLVLGLVGCIDVDTVVHVRPDGSGVVEEKMLMSGELVGLAAQMQSDTADDGSSGLYEREELEFRASTMGTGVSLVAVEPISAGQRKGYKAVYAFQDINKLRLNQNPGDRAPSGPGTQGADSKEEPITFKFTPGPTPELIVHSGPHGTGESGGGPSPKAKKQSGGPGNEAGAEMAMAMMKEMFKDLRISLSVEVEGRIVDTNATFREGSRVTLMELDFGKLLANSEKFKEFAESDPQSVADAKSLMQGIEGIKAELNPEIRIRFSASGDPKQRLVSAPPPAPVRPQPVARPPRPRQAPQLAARPPQPRQAPKATPAAYRWRTVDRKRVSQHLRKLVQVTDAGGSAHKGMLRNVNNGELTLSRAAVDGGGSVDIPLVQVRELRVFDRDL